MTVLPFDGPQVSSVNEVGGEWLRVCVSGGGGGERPSSYSLPPQPPPSFDGPTNCRKWRTSGENNVDA